MSSVAAKVLKETGVIEAKGENDTIRLWENYRDQALLWRSIALIQVPTTLAAIIFALVMWSTSEIKLNVPRKPLPGFYAAKEIPDSEFVDVATNFVNLIATYQSNVAKKQFYKASEMLKEPLLTRFKKEMLGTELQAIQTTSRTQIFFIDPLRTEVLRENKRFTTVKLTGERTKIISGKTLPSQKTEFTIRMTTIPRNELNPYGIVITNIQHEDVRR